MGQASLTFDIPEEQEQFEECVNGPAYHAVIVGLEEFLKAQLKFVDDDATANAYNRVREELYALKEEEGVES